MTLAASPAASVAEHLAALAAAHPQGSELVAHALASLSDLEAAALAYDWAGIWRRPKQAPPPRAWATFGYLTGRGFGKSKANAELVHAEAASGRAMRIALIGQNEDRCIEVMIEGESGLLACSPPWCKARYEAGRVIWPNGAQAFVYTPERPGELFGPEHHLGWASEVHVWPATKREEAWANLRMGLRLGYGRLVWDSNPSRRHPVIRELLADADEDPARNVVVRGSSHENKLNMTAGIVDAWERKYGGTQRGREMIDGEQSEEAEGALWQQAWIDSQRRDLPAQLRRRILIVDPAISARTGTDETGVIEAALDTAGQCYVVADLTGRLSWESWGELVVRRYVAHRCDCIVLERNRGGDACIANVRACAAKIARETDRDLRVEIVQADTVTRYVPGVIYAKEVVGRSSKGTRAEPVASHYEAGRVSHVTGADLANLEDLLTTWIPESKGESPNALDALVWGVLELAGLNRQERGGGAAAIRGASAMQAAIQTAPRAPMPNIEHLLGGGRGGRI